MKSHMPAVLVFVLGLGLLQGARADVWVPRAQTFAGVSGAHMGTSVAVGVGVDSQGHPIINRVYVGQPDADGPSGQIGAGYVQIYNPGPNGWVFAANLFSNTVQAGAHFGASLAYGSGHLVVGAPDYNDVGGAGANAGRVEFYFDNGTSPLNLSYKGSRTGTGGNFGSAVAVNVDMAAIGKTGGSGDGCVSTFHYYLGTGTWTNLPAVNDIVCGSTGAALGTSVAILRTSATSFLLVAGATGESQNANSLAGAAHVYIPNPNTTTGGFVEVGTLAANNPAAFDFFGTSVGIDANFIYVGATGRDNGAGRVGSVTIFKPASIIGYNYLSEYFPSAPATIGGLCGASLSVDAANSQFIMGCPNSASPYFAHEGTARVYRQIDFLGNTVWLDSVLSFGTQPHNGDDALGSSVAILGNEAIVGAPDFHYSGQSGNGVWKTFVTDKIFANGFQ